MLTERVETEEQKVFLISKECYDVQGNLFAKMESVEAIVQRLKETSLV